MKYKLATLPRGTAKLPVLDIGFSAITLQQGAQLAITPQTLNYLGNDQTFETSGYSCTVADVRLLNTFDATGINTSAARYRFCLSLILFVSFARVDTIFLTSLSFFIVLTSFFKSSNNLVIETLLIYYIEKI